jgi:transcriptional regulator with XRE-family HTH domain
VQLARLKEWREAQGLMQKELAAMAGTHERTVFRAEHGDSVNPVTTRRLAKALGVDVVDLLENPPVPAPKIARTAAAAEIERDQRTYMRANESGFQQIAFYPEWSRALEDLITRPPGELAEALLDTEKERQQSEQNLSRAEQRIQTLEQALAECEEERRRVLAGHEGG